MKVQVCIVLRAVLFNKTAYCVFEMDKTIKIKSAENRITEQVFLVIRVYYNERCTDFLRTKVSINPVSFERGRLELSSLNDMLLSVYYPMHVHYWSLWSFCDVQIRVFLQAYPIWRRFYLTKVSVIHKDFPGDDPTRETFQP